MHVGVSGAVQHADCRKRWLYGTSQPTVVAGRLVISVNRKCIAWHRRLIEYRCIYYRVGPGNRQSRRNGNLQNHGRDNVLQQLCAPIGQRCKCCHGQSLVRRHVPGQILSVKIDRLNEIQLGEPIRSRIGVVHVNQNCLFVDSVDAYPFVQRIRKPGQALRRRNFHPRRRIVGIAKFLRVLRIRICPRISVVRWVGGDRIACERISYIDDLPQRQRRNATV